MVDSQFCSWSSSQGMFDNHSLEMIHKDSFVYSICNVWKPEQSCTDIVTLIMLIWAKLLSSSGPGPGQVRGQEGQKLTWALLYFWFSPTHPPHHHKLFSWLLRGLDMLDGPRMGWYDSSRVWGGKNFQVDSKAEIKWDIREYFNESKVVW